jgi:hypothetical protein
MARQEAVVPALSRDATREPTWSAVIIVTFPESAHKCDRTARGKKTLEWNQRA